MSSNNTIALTRSEMEKILMFVRLHENVHTVILKQSNASGIGPRTVARFYSGDSSVFHEIEITDVENW